MEIVLTQEHLDEMREIMIACDAYKRQNLSQRSYYTWMDWAIKAAEQINDNHFEINSAKNTFAWLVDQVEHCPPVAATELGQSVLGWASMASQGAITYGRFIRQQNYKKLFN